MDGHEVCEYSQTCCGGGYYDYEPEIQLCFWPVIPPAVFAVYYFGHCGGYEGFHEERRRVQY